MAITIITEPTASSPAHNPCTFVFETDNGSLANFSFIVTLTVNGFVHSVHQVFIESGSRGRFNASEILKNLLSSSIDENNNFENDPSNSYLTYKITVQEKAGDPVPKPFGVAVDSTQRTAFNSSLSHKNFIDWISTDPPSDYFIYSAPLSGVSFMTYYPRPFTYKKAEFCGMSQTKILSIGNSLGSFNLIYRFYDSSGVLLNTVTEANSVSSRIINFNVSPEVIINDTSAVLADFDTAYSYSFQIDNGFFTSTEEYFIIIDRDCERYEHRRLTWLNKFGGWDSFTFKLRSKETTKVSSESYTSEVGQWNSDNDFVYPLFQGENKNSLVTSNDSIEINSDWISEDVQNWLSKSLLESPKIYLETDDGFELLLSDTNSFEKKKRVSDGLIQESYKFKRTYTNKSQLG